MYRWPLRLMLPFLLLVFGLLAIAAIYFGELRSSHRRVEAFETVQIRLLGSIISSDIESSLRRNDQASAQRSIERLRGDRDLVRAALIGPEGGILLSTHHEDRGKRLGETPFDQPSVRNALSGGRYQAQLAFQRESKQIVGVFPVVLSPLSGGVQSVEPGAFVTIHSLEVPFRFAKADALRRLRTAAVVLTVFCFLVWIFLRRVFLSRIQVLASATDKIATGDYRADVMLDGRDELAQLSESLRRMGLQLEKNAEELRRNERHYRSIIENMEDVISILDADFRIVYVSASTKRISGYPPEWFIGKSVSDIVPAEDAEHSGRLLAEVMEGKAEQCEFESRFRQADGSTGIYHTVCRPIDSEEGKRRLLLASRSVTAFKRTEMALRESKSRFDSLFDSLRDGAWAVSADAMEFIYGNRALERIYGRRVEEFKLNPGLWIETAHPEDRDVVARSMADVDEKGVADAEYRILRPDGETRWIHDRRQLIYDASGRVLRKGGLITDITEARAAAEARDRLEAQLRQTQKMEAIGTLAGGVAHDFNNLLTAINGYADLLQDAMGDDHGLIQEVREIRTAGERAAALTRQLLVFSRQDIAQARLVDLNVLVCDLNRMLTRLIGEHIEYHEQLAGEPLMVWADAVQVEQIVVNLVVNARDAMTQGGRLDVQTDEVRFPKGELIGDEQAPPGAYARLVVRDSGCGMSPTVLSRIFEPFFTTKEVGKGTGMGLSTIYGIVKQCLGYICVESEVGKGTTFEVYLPLAREQSTLTRSPDPNSDRLDGKETLLFVEDEQIVRGVGTRILRTRGYRVIEATGGDEALEIAAAGTPIDLVVTDMVMPGMTGRQLAERLLEFYPGIRVLFVSGYAERSMEDTTPHSENLPFLQKPYDPDTLAAKVREVLDGEPTVHRPR